MSAALDQQIASCCLTQRLQRIQLLIEQLGPGANSRFYDLAQPFRTMARRINGDTGTGNGPASIQRLDPIHLMRDINPHLAFSVSFLTSPKNHPLYARPWKQWRLARGEEAGKDVKT